MSSARAWFSRLASVTFPQIGHLQHQAGALAILGHQIDALADRVARATHAQPLPVKPNLAAEQPVDAEHGAGQRRAAGADEAGEAQDLPVAHRKRKTAVGERRRDDVHQIAAARRGFDLRRNVERFQVAADHEPDHRGVAHLLAGKLAHVAPVAQRDHVGRRTS